MQYDLRQIAKKRIINDIIKNTIKTQKSLGGILILDTESGKTLDKYVKMQDLIANGITIIENIEKHRKKYKNFIGIYFLQPTEKNIELIKEDFETKKLYKSLNVFFTKTIPDDLYAKISKMKVFKQAKNMKEVNLNFVVESSSLFKSVQPICFENSLETLFSVISTFSNLNTIEVLNLKNPIYNESKKIAGAIQKKIQALFPYIKAQDKSKGQVLKIFIFEREFDLISPLVHDFHYENLLIDLLQIDFNDVNVKGKKYQINQDDEIFCQYRYRFFTDALNSINSDLKVFKSENKVAIAKKNKDKDLRINQIQDILGSVGEFNKKMAEFECHTNLLNQIFEKIEETGMKELCSLEYEIISGVDEFGEKIAQKKRLELGINQIKKLQNEYENINAIRLAIIILGCIYNNSEQVIDCFKGDEKQFLLKMKKIISQFGKFWPENLKEEYRKMAKTKQKNFSKFQKFITKIEFLVSGYLQNNNSKQFNKKVFGEQTKSNFPNSLFKGGLVAKKKVKNHILVYIIGGVSYNEIRALKSLEAMSQNQYHFVIGGDYILSPKDFLNQMKSMQVKSNLIEF